LKSLGIFDDHQLGQINEGSLPKNLTSWATLTHYWQS